MIKMNIYQQAKARILRGEDHEKVLKEADESWSKYCIKYQFNTKIASN